MAATSWLPVSGRYHNWGMTPDFDRLDESERWEGVDMRFFVGDYFHTMGITLIQGEAAKDVDVGGARAVWEKREYAEVACREGDAGGGRG